MPSLYIQNEDWCQSKKRHIDDETLCDFLRILEYEAERMRLLQVAGIEDAGSPVEALYVYLLDALGVPEEGHIKLFPEGEDGKLIEYRFIRDWFDELIFSDFLLNNDKHQWDYIDVIEMIRKEVKEDLNNNYVIIDK